MAKSGTAGLLRTLYQPATLEPVRQFGPILHTQTRQAPAIRLPPVTHNIGDPIS